MFKSMKTTWAGILQFGAIVFTQVGTLLDGDTMTNPDYGLVVASLITLIGLIQARDNNVTSEAAGAVTDNGGNANGSTGRVAPTQPRGM